MKKIVHNLFFIGLGLSVLVLAKLNPLTDASEPLNQPRDFKKLSGWSSSKVVNSFLAFQASCKTFLSQNPNKNVGTSLVDIRIKDWLPVCESALRFNHVTEKAAHHFFQTWFTPIEFYKNKPIQGTFTGYYMPSIQGSLTPSKTYSVPIYGKPKDLVLVPNGRRYAIKRRVGKGLTSYYTRRQIDNGAIEGKAPVLAWVKSKVDRLFLEIEGAGVIKLTNGEEKHLTYAIENGAHYQSIPGVLIRRGLIHRNKASYANIKQYLEAHPNLIDSVLAENQSFVFFEALDKKQALGAQGTPLTSGYSLAVDRRYIPLGTPLWLKSHDPIPMGEKKPTKKRLMIAQDTGGAIKGMIRGDIFLGSGKLAQQASEQIKHQGTYLMLVPRHVAHRIEASFLKKTKG
jgi:membrane-bound lytic murein transglycosylase A